MSKKFKENEINLFDNIHNNSRKIMPQTLNQKLILENKFSNNLNIIKKNYYNNINENFNNNNNNIVNIENNKENFILKKTENDIKKKSEVKNKLKNKIKINENLFNNFSERTLNKKKSNYNSLTNFFSYFNYTKTRLLTNEILNNNNDTLKITNRIKNFKNSLTIQTFYNRKIKSNSSKKQIKFTKKFHNFINDNNNISMNKKKEKTHKKQNNSENKKSDNNINYNNNYYYNLCNNHSDNKLIINGFKYKNNIKNKYINNNNIENINENKNIKLNSAILENICNNILIKSKRILNKYNKYL